MRGPHFFFCCKFSHNRITPACAGTTDQWVNFLLQLQDHPRLCGDHGLISSRLQWLLGSPPPVRGPRMIKLKVMVDVRITPACAGTTMPTSAIVVLLKDHPRLCGDHIKFSFETYS